ncbi:MAG: hypothetical protein ABI334_04400 [Candidatus Dormiibacterota bacterium]
MSTQVRLRRLIRTFAEALERLRSQAPERGVTASLSDRLMELSTEVREAWRRESLGSPQGGPLDSYVRDSVRSMELAIVGLQQAGADLELLRADFEAAALPLEVFMRGLDVEPALQRSA